MFEDELRDAIQLSVQDAADRIEEIFPDINREILVNHLRAAIMQSIFGMCETAIFKMSGAFPRDLHTTYHSKIR